jgi:hypothetical protein
MNNGESSFSSLLIFLERPHELAKQMAHRSYAENVRNSLEPIMPSGKQIVLLPYLSCVSFATCIVYRVGTKASKSSKRPLLFVWPIPGILRVDCFFNIFNLTTFFVHGIGIQRNLLADQSADGVTVCIAVEVITVSRGHVAPAITGYPL